MCLLLNPASVEAWATVALAGLTLVTLIVLFVYAWDTKKIARASVEQLENSQMPFITVSEETDNISKLENQGVGVALNVQGRVYHRDGATYEIIRENIGPGGTSRRAISVDSSTLRNARFEYASLSGREYVTEIDQAGIAKFLKVSAMREEETAKARWQRLRLPLDHIIARFE
jgi:hypothetical protein